MDYLIIRLISSFLTGLILSQTGSLIQLGTRNVLSSPSTLGFDGLAVLWLLIFHSVFVFLGSDPSPLILILTGIPLFWGVGFLFTKFLSGRSRYEKIILLGLTFNLLVGAIFSLWQFFFLAFNQPFPVEVWFGHFRFADMESLGTLMIFELLLASGLFVIWKDLLLYSLGSTVAHNFQLNEKRFFLFLFSAVALGTFMVVGLYGAFSFLGLIFPIVARRLWFKTKDLKGEFFIGSILNGILLMLIDLLCYSLPIFGAEVPVGLIVTAVGAVFLILLLWKSDSGIIGKAQ